MKITVLMSVYNGHKFLKEQIDSIRRQSVGFDNIQLVIRDDGSEDDSCQMLEEMRLSNMELHRGENLGTADSFWELLKTVKPDSDYYAFSDQDDIWHEDKLEVAIRRLDNTELPQLYYSNVEIADQDGRGTGLKLMKERNRLSVIAIMAGLHALGCTMVFNQAALRLYQSARLTGIEMHDRSCFLMTYLMGKVIFDMEPRMYYRQHDNNVIGNEGKKGIAYLKKRIRKSFVLWFKSEQHSAIVQATDMLNNFEKMLREDDRKYLRMIAGYRKHWKYKWYLLTATDLASVHARVRRSFRLRILIHVF